MTSQNSASPPTRTAVAATAATSAAEPMGDVLPDHTLSPAQHVLTALRDELDGIDRDLLEALRARLALCCRIGAHKARHAIAMMQPHRIGVVQARASDFAKLHGINPAFLHALYELIIAETCRLEDEVIAGEKERS